MVKGVDVVCVDFYFNVDLMVLVGFSVVGGGMLEFFCSVKYIYSVGLVVILLIFDGGCLCL